MVTTQRGDPSFRLFGGCSSSNKVGSVSGVGRKVLAGELPAGVLRQVRDLLSQHGEEALRAFSDALQHQVPRKLGESEEHHD